VFPQASARWGDNSWVITGQKVNNYTILQDAGKGVSAE